MKTLSEKEKKFNTALSKLINLNFHKNLEENLESLGVQKKTIRN